MTTILERTIVHCSVNQAASHLAHFFHARGNSSGDMAKLSLRADVPVPGSTHGVRLARTAIATLAPVHTAGEMMPHYSVIWAPEHDAPYPTFRGDLAIESADDYSCFYLVLRGQYEAPFGVVGAAFDAVVGRRIAESTARNLLATIAGSIETDFHTVEELKAHARAEQLDHVTPGT